MERWGERGAKSHDEHEEPSARTIEARRQRQQATGKEESDDEPGKRQWRRRRTENSILVRLSRSDFNTRGYLFVRTARPQPQPAGLV